ncbi:MAG TPA: glycine/sarcosine/betaine reductase selenoprotein B family protein [Desulfomonilia bacterium]|nr:glycine/sarcosine/betaine reductase selenoprotein B family protein [Desulfomonilia bacterium]
MGIHCKVVDGYRFLPPTLRALLKREIPETGYEGDIPWTPLRKSVSKTVFSLVTSAGIRLKTDLPFDMEQEKQEPFWGDPTHREIPRDTSQEQIDASHLHVDTGFMKEDINVILPIHRFAEFEKEGNIGRLAPTCHSFYGYQHDFRYLMDKTMPEVAKKMHDEEVEAVVLTPACPLCCRSVGLVARYLETQGFSTVVLTPIPEFNRLIGIPRVAGIEYPFGRPVGQVHDIHGQRAVLLETISFLAGAKRPGEEFHLPFTWPEEPRETKWHPPEVSPILKLFKDEIKKIRDQGKV